MQSIEQLMGVHICIKLFNLTVVEMNSFFEEKEKKQEK